MIWLLPLTLSVLAAQVPAPPAPKIVPATIPANIVLSGGDSNFVRPLSVAEAVQIALERQRQIAIANGNFGAARGRTQQVRAGFNPTLSANTGYSRSNDIRGKSASSSSTSGFNSGLTVNQLVYDFNLWRDQVRQAQALERVESNNLTVTQFDLVLRVKQAFYAVRQNDRLVSVAESNVQGRTVQKAFAKARVDAGFGAPPDVVRAQTDEDQAILELVQARANATLSRVSLAQALGVDPRTPLQVADSSEPEVPGDDVSPLVDIAVKRRPEILSAQETLRAAGIGVSVARKANQPAIFANAGVTSRGDSDPTDSVRGTFGLTLSWDLLDGGVQRGRVREARAKEAVAKANYELQLQNVVADVSTAYVNLRIAEQRVSLTRSQVTNALEGVRLATGRYRGGVGTFLEVTDAQAALVLAQTNQVNAETALQSQRAALQRAIGAPLG
jgi:outer membrane protein TolC